MKLEKSKHAHNLTKLLKVGLFGIVMILPFLAILPSTLYFAFNEHAQNYTHETVNTTYEYETNEVNSVDDLVIGNIYMFTISERPSVSTAYITNSNMIRFYTGDVSVITTYNDNLKFNYNYSNNRYYITQGASSTTISVLQTEYIVYPVKCYFIYQTNGIDTTQISLISASDYLGEKNVEVVSSEQSPLKAFYSASNELWQQPMFNWVNTGLGGIAIANMLSVFGIGQNTFISNILIYWLSITAIYIIIDIVIELFVALTHLIGKKAD